MVTTRKKTINGPTTTAVEINRINMNVATKNKSKSTNVKPQVFPTTHKCLQNVLTAAQIFGAFPIDNLRDDRPEKLEFHSKSWKVILSVTVSFGYLFFASLSFYKASTQGIFLNQLISPLFYFDTFLTVIIFTKLASKWPKFMSRWSKIEDQMMRKYENPSNLHRKVNYSAVCITIIALVEHTLSVLNVVNSTFCQNDSIGWQRYFRKQFHFIFRYMPYNFFFGLVLTILNWIAAWLWNLCDMFLILISMVITSRFNQITRRIQSYVNELSMPFKSEVLGGFIKVYQADFPKSEFKFWREMREDYDRMNQIVGHLNEILANLVLLSYSFNLTFILIQLFNSLRQMETAIEGIYFFYSFGFVIARIVVVSIYGASINEESQAALPYLNSIPTEIYNEEIQRLITQIHVDSAALTGHNFFRVTKGLVLSVAAAIITYELVLIQFNQATLDKYNDMSPSNSTICF